MKHFFVISNESKDKDLQTANRIKEYLEQKQCVCKVATDYGADTSKEFSTDIEEIPEETEHCFRLPMMCISGIYLCLE